MLRAFALRNCLALVCSVLALPLLGESARAQSADSFIVVDAGTGRILNARNPDVQLYPASMTKIMTLYLTFEALSQGRLSLSTPLSVTQLAAEQAPSRLGLRPGSTISVQSCVLAAVTLSANDCAMVLAENIGGSEAQFAQMMTSRAHSLGMTNTHWNNPNGLPDPQQLTTARDMAVLAEATIQRFPKYYRYFSTRSFTYNGINHPNHNHLMSRYPGMDGIKTGFIRASGFNLTASAVRNGHRLIAVVFGGSSAVARDNYMAGLLDDGFSRVGGQPPASGAMQETIASAPLDTAAPPPEKPQLAAENSIARLAAPAGKVDGVDLSEAGDDVEGGEGSPASPAAIVAAPLPGMPSPTPAALQTASSAGYPATTPPPVRATPSAGPATLAVTEADLTSPSPSVVTSPPPPLKPEAPAQGDADASEAPAAPLAPRAPMHNPSYSAPQAGRNPTWGVEIGTYSSRLVSDAILQKAVATLPQDVRGAAHPVSVALHARHRHAYRAELTGLNELQAKRACSVLTHCVPVKS